MSNATRTPQQAMADAIKSGAVQAWIDGKNIQARIEGKDSWDEFEGYSKRPAFTSPDLHWRPAPTPRLRPWKPEEVPITAIYKAGKESTILRTTSYKDSDSGGLYLHNIPVNPTELFDSWVHSLDGGKTWEPCGVQEGGE